MTQRQLLAFDKLFFGGQKSVTGILQLTIVPVADRGALQVLVTLKRRLRIRPQAEVLSFAADLFRPLADRVGVGDVHDIGKNIVGVVLACNGYEIIDLGVMVPAEKILDCAEKEKVDFIGLSGLITPSLDEMVHVAAEIERRDLKVPLLIGGATTSRMHTAVKIAPRYSRDTLHVLDASRAVTAVSGLLSSDARAAFIADNRREQERLRKSFEERDLKLLAYGTVRDRRPDLAWTSETIAKPDFLGTRVLNPVPLADVIDYIDWTPFFNAWELRGVYPDILEKPDIGEAARELFENAQTLLGEIVEGKKLTARAVYGFFPANRYDDDI